MPNWLLQASGMSVQTLDLSEVLGWVARMGDDDSRVAHKLAEIKAYERSELADRR